MKILIYGINNSPELTGIGKYTGEMSDWFAANGNEVVAISAPPYYPDPRTTIELLDFLPHPRNHHRTL